jgi:hypothetical protein
MQVIGHEAVRNYCEALNAGGVTKLRRSVAHRGSVGEQRATIMRANSEEVALDSEIVECLESRGRLERHEDRSAAAVPSGADLKVRLYGRE